MEEFESIEKDLEKACRGIERLDGVLQELREKLREVQQKLQTEEKDKKLLQEQTDYRNEIEKIEGKRSELLKVVKDGLEKKRNELKSVRKEQDSLDKKLRNKRGKLFETEQKLNTLQRVGRAHEDDEEGEKLLQEHVKYKSDVKKTKEDLLTLKKTAANLSATLTQLLRPQVLVEVLDDSIPFLLLPVCLETKFVNNEATNNKPELWVRIFPDEIAIETHEEPLTDDEMASGKIYWQEIWKAADNKEKEIAAWRALVSEGDTPRAAWIAKVMEPINNQNKNPQLSPPPSFPEPTLRESSWSQAPRTRVMPDRFVITTYRGEEVDSVVGKPIRTDPLIVGPDPSEIEDDEEGFQQTEDELQFAPSLEWLADFHKAVDSGMAVRIELTPEQSEEGFDRIVALGLRLSSDELDGKERLETLLNNHHYAEGLRLLPQGTPTNNTEDSNENQVFRELDAEVSYQVERGDPLFTPEGDDFEKSDGQRLAEALGIDENIFHHVYHSHYVKPGDGGLTVSAGYDGHEAKAMNRTLWPATLGYFMEEMMRPIFQLDTIRKTRHFFTRYVSGRGMLPTIKAGDQPYGILPTSDFSQWEWSRKYSDRYLIELCQVLKDLDTRWEALSEKVAYVGKSEDPEKELLDILGLHATSVEFYQRRSIGSEYMWNLMNFVGWTSEALNWDTQSKILAGVLLQSLGFDFAEIPRIFDLSYFTHQAKLTGPLVDEEPASESKPIQPIAPELGNYIAWLGSRSIDDIRNQDFGENSPPRALLYLLLRHSLLLSYWDTAMQFNVMANALPVSARQEIELLNLGEQHSETRWDHFNMPISAAFGRGEINEPTTIGEFIQTSAVANYDEAAEMLETKSALTKLDNLPTARLERLLVEHLDLCSYRLDAWQLGMANLRLLQQRTNVEDRLVIRNQEAKRDGIYLGAFGWLEDLRPGPAGIRVPPEEIPEGFEGPNAEPLTYAPNNAGSMIGPSLNHAATLSILRNALITHANTEKADLMSIDLSSERVRRALDYFDGINNGQELAALLGYKFERGLHDRNATLHLDQYILKLRKNFPLVSDQITESAETDAIEALEARNVVNGLDLTRTAREKNYPYGVKGLPRSGSREGRAIREEIDRIMDDLDAIGDLALAEGVWQVSQGNFDRSGAIMKAISEGGNLPEPEFIRTPRSGYAFTHRITLNFDGNSPSDNPWPQVTMSPRAKTEPRLNNWLGIVLGDPSKVVCLVDYTDPSTNRAETPEVSLENLNLQPVDFLYASSEDLEGPASELERRISYYVRKDKGLLKDTPITIRFIDRKLTWDTGIITFFELLPLINSLREIITGCRPLAADDLYLPSEDEDETEAPIADRKRFDVGELEARTKNLAKILSQSYNDLKTEKQVAEALTAERLEISSTIPPNLLDNLRDKLLDAAQFGIYNAIPTYAVEATLEARDELVRQAEIVLNEINKRIGEGQDAIVAATNASTPENQIQKLIEAIQSFYGGSYKVMPIFTLHNAPEVKQALDNTQIETLIAENWLQGLTRVRPKIGTYEMVRLMADTFENVKLGLTVIQLPFIENDRWIGLPLIEGQTLEGDKLSLVMQLPYDPESIQSGLVIDEWPETIPSPRDTTGIAFHYDQPNSEPPQALLLVVTPKETGEWKWDDLMSTLLGTLKMAKKRAVEPDILDQTALAHLLPAIMTAAAYHPETFAVNYASTYQFACEVGGDE